MRQLPAHLVSPRKPFRARSSCSSSYAPTRSRIEPIKPQSGGPCPGKLLKGGDAVLRRGMGSEQIVHADPRQRIDDKERRSRRVLLSGRVLDLAGRIVEFAERRDEPE